MKKKEIAIANQKGGTGKTTTAVNLEIGLADKMRLDAMNRQGERTDLTSAPVARKSERGRESDIEKILMKAKKRNLHSCNIFHGGIK